MARVVIPDFFCGYDTNLAGFIIHYIIFKFHTYSIDECANTFVDLNLISKKESSQLVFCSRFNIKQKIYFNL
jgi:hypothetical protein